MYSKGKQKSSARSSSSPCPWSDRFRDLEWSGVCCDARRPHLSDSFPGWRRSRVASRGDDMRRCDVMRCRRGCHCAQLSSRDESASRPLCVPPPSSMQDKRAMTTCGAARPPGAGFGATYDFG
nr:hypothetical protein CFP56_56486 [Quercus suber]